jgi:preprotein translocase subunit SecD
MARHRLQAAAGVLVALLLASCGEDDGDGATTESVQDDGASISGELGQVLQQFAEEGSATDEFVVLDWEANLVRRLPATRPASEGTKVVEATGSAADALCPSRCFFLIRDRPALTGADIASAELEFDPVTDQPTVALTLTPEGQDRFAELTREVAERGARQSSAGAPSESAGHIALILDDRLLSLPIIDFTENPKGIEASSGVQIAGGFSATEAERLAQALNPD